MRILLIEDEAETAAYLLKALRESGHVGEHAPDGESGLAAARSATFDVLIVDRMLPRLDGLALIETLRADGNRTPVLILSALGAVDDRVKGLRAGGDDYLPKPFAFTELLARIEALTRRQAPEATQTRYVVGDLVLDRLSHKVTRAGEAIVLQPREYRLLEYLMRMPVRWSPARCCSRMSGITISTRKPMSSTCTCRGCAPRSTKASTGPCWRRCAAPAM